MSQVGAVLAGGSWGWLPVLSLLGAVGVLLVAIADTAARNSVNWAEPLFWTGVLVAYAPITARLAASDIRRGESMSLVAVLALQLYLVKVLHSPLAFTDHDEFLHWRNVINVMQSNHLFGFNPLLPASADFPGLESVTTALMHLSGLSVFGAGLLIVGIARIVLVLALYLIFEQLSGSLRVAGLAVAIYMGNPNFVFFGGMFKYESLALTFAAVALFALVRRERADATWQVGWTALSLLVLGAMVITHHLTAYIFTAFLAIWTVVAARLYRGRRNYVGPGRVTVLLVAANVAWLIFVAGGTIGYLAPVFGNAITQTAQLLIGHFQVRRPLFVSSSGRVSPLWEQVTALTSVGLILLGLPFGLRQVWRNHRSSAIVLTLALSTLAYPLILPLRLTTGGWETSNRSSEFLFIAIGFILALWVAKLGLPRQRGRHGPVVVAACASIIVVGGVIAGWPPLWRLPGPYLPAQDTRSVEPQGVMAATWARSYLGLHQRIGADRINHVLMGTYGDQDVSTNLSGGIDVNWVLFAPSLNSNVKGLISEGRLHHLVVDHRLTGAPQVAHGYYPKAAVAPALAKFDHIKGVSRVFDGGDIRIYDVGAISGHP